MAVPYTFGAATAAIPLSQLDSNFASTITLGNTAIQLGNTVTILNNMTLANVTVSSGTLSVTTATATTANLVTINATTLNAATHRSDGSLVLQTNGTTTAVTIDGSQNVTFAKGFTVGATAAPAFSVSSTALVSSAASTFTKITYDTEDFDTNSNFASSRFTPTVAGYYQFNVSIAFGGIVAAGATSFVTLYKNGSRFLDGNLAAQISGITTFNSVSGIIYLNGSTDYVEVYGFQTAGTQNIGSGQSSVKFTGSMIRSA